jgi:hypothetical protein
MAYHLPPISPFWDRTAWTSTHRLSAAFASQTASSRLVINSDPEHEETLVPIRAWTIDPAGRREACWAFPGPNSPDA